MELLICTIYFSQNFVFKKTFCMFYVKEISRNNIEKGHVKKINKILATAKVCAYTINIITIPFAITAFWFRYAFIRNISVS